MLNTLFSSSFSKTATLAPLFLWRSKYPVLFKSDILLSSINSYALQFETFIATLQSILFFLFSIFFQIFIQYHIWRGNVKNLSGFFHFPNSPKINLHLLRRSRLSKCVRVSACKLHMPDTYVFEAQSLQIYFGGITGS